MTGSISNQPPGGLYLLAVLCLLLGVMGAMGFFRMAFGPPPEAPGPQKAAAPPPDVAPPEDEVPAKSPPSAYDLVSAAITSVLYIGTGIGLFMRNRWLGYYLGNVTGVLVIVNAMAFGLMQGAGGLALQVHRMIAPMVLLILLNMRYSHLFQKPPSNDAKA